MIEEINEMFEELNKSKFFENIAESYMKMYRALLNQGFSREETMSILCSQGVGIKTQ